MKSLRQGLGRQPHRYPIIAKRILKTVRERSVT